MFKRSGISINQTLLAAATHGTEGSHSSDAG